MRWEGPQQQDRPREREQCEWWPGCTLPPLAAESLGGVESGKSWLGPGRLEFRRQGSRTLRFRRQPEPGRRPCYESKRVLGLALGQFGRVLLQSGTGLKRIIKFSTDLHRKNAFMFHPGTWPGHP